MNIMYDNKEHKQAVYQLWQDAFQDPDPFAEYYFQQVYPGNPVIVAKEERQVYSTLPLNPYNWIRERSINARQQADFQLEAASVEVKSNVLTKKLNLHYIVGVATKQSQRRKGLMAGCLTKALQDMEENGEPFTYLMPANPAYYEPFQFVMWKEEKHLEADNWLEILEQLPQWQYSMYPARTEEYLTRLQAEVESEQGAILKGEHDAYVAYVIDRQQKKVIIQQVFFGKLWEPDTDPAVERKLQVCFWQQVISKLQKQYEGWKLEIIESQPMMLRVLNIREFIKLLPYQGEEKNIEIQVKDSICKSNEGRMRIVLSEEGCHAEDLEAEKAELTVPEWDIAEVTQFLLKESQLADFVYLMEIV